MLTQSMHCIASSSAGTSQPRWYVVDAMNRRAQRKSLLSHPLVYIRTRNSIKAIKARRPSSRHYQTSSRRTPHPPSHPRPSVPSAITTHVSCRAITIPNKQAYHLQKFVAFIQMGHNDALALWNRTVDADELAVLAHRIYLVQR